MSGLWPSVKRLNTSAVACVVPVSTWAAFSSVQALVDNHSPMRRIISLAWPLNRLKHLHRQVFGRIELGHQSIWFAALPKSAVTTILTVSEDPTAGSVVKL